MGQSELFSQANNGEWSEARMSLLMSLWRRGKSLEDIASEMKAPLDVVASKVSKLIKEES